MDVRPIQVVDSWPQKSQFRVSKQADQPQARTLLAALKKGIPQTVLLDMSNEYEQVGWIEPGHFELWLAPRADSIVTP